MNTEIVPINDLITDPENVRLHSEENIEAIVSSLRRFGQVLPIVVRDKIVVGGNGTLEAMHRLAFEHVKIVQFKGTAKEAKALAIALNRTAELAEWDLDALGESLVHLSEGDFSHESLGFSEAALDDLFSPSEEVIAEPPKKQVTFEAKTDAKATKYSLVVNVESKAEAKDLKGELEDHGFSVRITSI